MQAAAFLREENAKHQTQVSISFGEKMDRAELRKAWESVAAVHAILRTSFSRSQIGEVTAVVADSGGTIWKEVDWQEHTPESIPDQWSALQNSDAITPSDPHSPVRITEILLPGWGTHYLLTVPPFLLDEPSIARILLDWLTALERPPAPLEEIPATTASPAVWAELLKHAESPLALQMRPAASESVAATKRIGREETKRFLAACKDVDAGCVIESLWALALRRLGATGNLTLRRFDARRSRADVGYFENWLPVVHSWDSKQWLADAAKRAETAAENAWISPGSALAAGAGDIKISDIRTAFVWSGPEVNDIIHTAFPRWINFDARIRRKSGDLLVLEARPGLTLTLEGPLGSESAAHELLAHLSGLIESFESFESKPPAQIPLLTPQESRILKECSRGPEPTEGPSHALQAFRNAADRFPDAVAVRDGDYELTYRELDSLSDRLAAHLAHASLAGGWHVALFLSHSSWIAIALIGSWKAGNACLALDPSAPPEWIESMLASHDAGVVLCDAASAPLLDTSTRKRIILDQEWDSLEFAEVPASVCESDSPAAILPGHSDGAAPLVRALTHEMLASAAREGAKLINFVHGSSLLAHSAAGSGAFFDEWLIPLLTGGTVRVADDDVLDPAHAAVTHLRLTAPEYSNQAARWTRGEPATETPLQVVCVEMGTATSAALDIWNQKTDGRVKTVTFFSPAGLCGLGLAGTASPDGPLLTIGKPVAGTESAITDEDLHDLPPGYPGLLFMKYPGWKSHFGKRGRRGIETGLRAWRNPVGDIQVEGTAAPGMDRSPRCNQLLDHKGVLGAVEGDHLWALTNIEVQGAIALPEWPLTRGGWIDQSLLPRPHIHQPKPVAKPAAPEVPRPAENTIPWVPVRVLQPEGNQPPLVLVPPASGLPETYRDLVAALGTTRKILGLTARGATHPESCHTTIESASAAWLDALLEEDPSVAFDLCGFGFGAIAALEMARQLAAAKRPIPGLILIGAPPPQSDSASGWLSSVKNAFKRLNTNQRIEPFAAMGEAARAHESAWARYRYIPTDIHARIIIPSDFSADAAQLWLDTLPQAEIEQVKCNWAEMLSFPAVKRLASLIGN